MTILEGTETVLVVDDEIVMLSLAEMMLEHNGYTVLTATSGQEGILAIPDYVSNTPDKPIIHFEERPSGTPEAIHT
jgi:response regulator RpfG family c-di-GMP phosphodiesterase